MRTRVKVCGITCATDARLVVAAGADALGFVFAPSPRRVTPAQAAAIIADGAPPLVTTVGVFVDETAETVAAAAREAHLSAVQ
ncbi:MAG: N-(5'-phosphoribosyl)anthranilate isomerase, partial [Armatimonadota bacterium]|nr:N-(5'-phosphoribosyl)anthranilate isomerase [Armatimonadota bacterium]